MKQKSFTPTPIRDYVNKITKNRKLVRGFTLIELLVAIAIIGILAATVVVVLNSARKKARDARIRTDLGQIPKLTQLWIDDHGNLNNFCDKNLATGKYLNSNYQTLVDDIIKNGGNEPICNASNEDFAVSSDLNNPGDSWCVANSVSMRGVALGTKCVASASNPPQPNNFSYFYIIQGNANLTAAQIDFMVTHYNYLLIKGWLSVGNVDKIKQAAAQKNPKFRVLKYTDGMFSLSYKPANNSLAYAYNQNSTETYKRIRETQYNQGWFLMDACSQEWRDYFVNQAKSEIDQYHLDGIMIDDMGIASGLHSVNRIDNFPQNRTTRSDYSDANWYQCGGQFLSQVKNQLSKVVIFNGLYHNPPQFDRDYLQITDGGIREGWITSNYSDFLDETKWKQLLDASIKDLNQYGSSFVPLCIINNPNATVDDALYCFTSFLLIDKDNQVHYGGPKGPNGETSLYYRPELSINIGTPAESGPDLAYYRSPVNSNLYERDYTGGKVIVNPTQNSVTYSLSRKYYRVIPSGSGLVGSDGSVDAHLDYQEVNGEITIGPQTGVVLLLGT